jgi:hypothetical protein
LVHDIHHHGGLALALAFRVQYIINIGRDMPFSRPSSLTTLVALAALSLFTSSSAAEGAHSYNVASPQGPSHWGDIAVVDNQCNGRKNSPIAVKDPGCTMYADYNLTVSIDCSTSRVV